MSLKMKYGLMSDRSNGRNKFFTQYHSKKSDFTAQSPRFQRGEDEEAQMEVPDENQSGDESPFKKQIQLMKATTNGKSNSTWHLSQPKSTKTLILINNKNKENKKIVGKKGCITPFTDNVQIVQHSNNTESIFNTDFLSITSLEIDPSRRKQDQETQKL